jgi:hypothetical protein
MQYYSKTQRMSPARKHELVGYELYKAGQPITACQSNDQRRGWNNAYIGHMAAVTAEIECTFDQSRGW